MLATLTFTICVVIKEVLLLVDDEWGKKQAKMETEGKGLSNCLGNMWQTIMTLIASSVSIPSSLSFFIQLNLHSSWSNT